MSEFDEVSPGVAPGERLCESPEKEIIARNIILRAVDEGIKSNLSFMEMGKLFPAETRMDVVEALRILGFSEAASVLQSITGSRDLGRLWDD